MTTPASPGLPSPAGADPFGGRLGWGRRPAVLVVDLVRAYTEPRGPFALPDPGPAVRATERLVDAARTAGRPVVWTQVRYLPDLSDGGLFVLKVPALAAFAAGGPDRWGDLVLPPRSGEPVVVKQFASGFVGTTLARLLRDADADTVVLAGFSTSGCVRATATDALHHGFRPVVVADACADRDAHRQGANLADLDAKYADVVGLDDALAHLAGDTAAGQGL